MDCNGVCFRSHSGLKPRANITGHESWRERVPVCVCVCGTTAVKRSILPSAPYGMLSVCQCVRMPQSLPAATANLHGEGHTGQHMSTWPFVRFETIGVLEGGATNRGNAEDTPHD